ncbi:MAG: hypothetical protein ACQERF_04655 [Actinomycetota bacterium]
MPDPATSETAPPETPVVFRAAEVREAAGFLGDSRNLSRRPDLHAIRTGSYMACSEWAGLTAKEQHLYLVRETVQHFGSDLLVSDRSAADLWGIPYLGERPDKVEVTKKRVGGGRSSGHLHYRTTKKLPDPVDFDGVAVTSPARTAVDIARTLGFASGLMAFDHVLASKLTTVEDLVLAIADLARRIDRVKAEAVLVRADRRSESPAESLARARMYQIGAPIPDLQREFFVNGVLVGRTDFYWEDADCIGEMDGDVKYLGGGASGGRPAEQIVLAEKRREDALRRIVTAFIRFIWDDALAIAPLEAELRRVGVLTGPKVRKFGA